MYRVIKFQPGGVHKAVVTLCGSGFFCAGVAKHEGVCRDVVTKRYPIGQHTLPHEWGKICSILSTSFGTTAENRNKLRKPMNFPIRPLMGEKTLPEVATSQHVAMAAVRPFPSLKGGRVSRPPLTAEF